MSTDRTAAPTTAAPPRAHDQLPGLTGLRGIAVLAVVAYHLGYLRGGFVGVDLFFVLSGFLITSLLLKDTPEGPSGLLRWWGRRVRRLTPAVAVMVLAVLVAFVTTSGIALDSFATLTWWQNWRLVLEGTPYWAGSPSPLRHTWSLSIEEQFYLLWPPILLGVMALGRRTRRPTWVLAGFAAASGVLSFLWAAWLAMRTTPNLSRIYFGTDTRAGALLLGCVAAALMFRRRRIRSPHATIRPAPRVTALLAPAAALGLVVLSVTMEPSDRWAYTGGLAAAAACSLVLVLAATRSGLLATLAAPAPIQWLGTRSYAIYLWSWPIQIFLETRFETMAMWQVAVITLLATFPLADLSMRLVEEPLRRGSWWASAALPRRAAWSLGAGVLAVTMLIAANSTELTVDEQVAEEFERQPDPTTPAETTTTCVPTTAPAAPEFGNGTEEVDNSTVTKGADPVAALDCQGVQRLLVVGDSTARGAANGLRRVAPEGFEIWDRSELGCGFVNDLEKCPDWQPLWTDAVTTIDPDVVLVIVGVSDDIRAGNELPFMSPEASAARREIIGAAMQELSAGGAQVIWNTPATPAGTFYCGGEAEDSPCDPVWVQRWNEDVVAAAAANGASTLDVATWVQQRGTLLSDRPDGLHLSGPALDDQARWIVEQIRTVQ